MNNKINYKKLRAQRKKEDPKNDEILELINEILMHTSEDYEWSTELLKKYKPVTNFLEGKTKTVIPKEELLKYIEDIAKASNNWPFWLIKKNKRITTFLKL